MSGQVKRPARGDGPPTAKRAYGNESRRAASDATRRRILDEAFALMVERGYRGTTVAELARRAEVHVDTVYELVGRKPVLLRALIERAISGADGPVEPAERQYVREMRAEPDAARKLERYARAMREIHGRMAPLLLALRDAATTEADAAAVWAEISARRAGNMRELARELEATGSLRAGLDIDEVADTIWVTNSPDVYLLLTVERGWSPERYERWLAGTWQRLLLRG